MGRRMCVRFGILVLLAILCSSRLGYTQSQTCVDTAAPSHAPLQKTKINVVGVEFQGEDPFPDTLRAQLVEDIQHSEIWVTAEEADSSWISDALTPMREELRSQGYFKTSVDATPYLTLAQANERRYVLRVVIETGPQYRLGNLRFASVSDTPLIFTEAILREQMHVREGDLFNVTKIRHGLESISRLFGSKGYIDATSEPDTTVLEKDSRIDLLIKVDEQKRYRIAKLEFLGLEAATQKSLTAAQEIGDPFNRVLWESFFEANRTHFPADASLEKNMRVRRDVRDGTVNVTLDFRPCPKTGPLDW